MFRRSRERGNEFICDTERVVWQDLGARKRSPSRTLIATINGPGRDPFTRSRIPGNDHSVLRLAVASPCCEEKVFLARRYRCRLSPSPASSRSGILHDTVDSNL